MPRKRKSSNAKLPPYVMCRSGRYYLEPKGDLVHRYGGRKSIPLGKTFTEMYMRYVELSRDCRLSKYGSFNQMNELLDRYVLEVTPKKAESGQKREINRLMFLKEVFGEMHPASVTTLDIYEFIDWRTEVAPIGVNRDLSLLSSVFKKGVRWGAVKASPMIDIERNRESPRERYVTHEEYVAFREYALKRNPVIAWYMDFKYLCGLRAIDIRSLEQSQFTEEGIALKISKNQTNRLIAWTPIFRQVTENLITACGRELRDERGNIVRPRLTSGYVLFTHEGTPYTADGWRSVFYRLMRNAVEDGVLVQPFCDHDIRAKAGSDHESVEAARKFLAHLSNGITMKHYRRKAEIIQPLM